MNYEFTLERLIDATPDEVFEALTNPVAQREWWTGDDDVEAACDLRVGGSAFVEWTTEKGHRCRAEQTYLEIDPPRRLVFNETVIEPDAPVYQCTLTITLEDQAGKTLYTLHHTGFPTVEERDKHEAGTKSFSGRLERYLARVKR